MRRSTNAGTPASARGRPGRRSSVRAGPRPHRPRSARGIAALLVDRNVRRSRGGVYVPFLGARARTTPLPAVIAQRHDVPVHPMFCLPIEGGRYRLWVGPDLTQGLPQDGDPHAWRRALLVRLNDIFEELIRARPELWAWSIKRYKARPTVELGRYPPYSCMSPIGRTAPGLYAPQRTSRVETFRSRSLG
ncbi:MAG: lysophospholipid acyltransferase family protein [Planctomycetota bacterium]